MRTACLDSTHPLVSVIPAEGYAWKRRRMQGGGLSSPLSVQTQPHCWKQKEVSQRTEAEVLWPEAPGTPLRIFSSMFCGTPLSQAHKCWETSLQPFCLILYCLKWSYILNWLFNAFLFRSIKNQGASLHFIIVRIHFT